MKKHASSEDMKRDLDALAAKVNALEVTSSDEHQKGVAKVLRALVNGQIHSINEFEHLKKAIDLVTLELFKAQKKAGS